MSKSLQAIGLFEGIGGFSLGAKKAGISTVAMVEIDQNCRKLLQEKFNPSLMHDDVKTFTRKEFESHVKDARIDVVYGGSPCQDVSIGGYRAGLAGKRSGLWFEMLRIIGEFAPAWVVFENVPGLLSSNDGRDFATILQGLADCGYLLAWRVLDAQGFGLAQRRKRVFLVGHYRDGRAAQVLFEPQSVYRGPEQGREKYQTYPSITGTLSTNGGGSSRVGGGQGGEINFYLPVRAKCLTAHKGHRYDTKTETFIGTKDGVRRLMPIECERLQGFPDNWTAGFSDSVRYKMLGNAVAVNVAAWIFTRLVRASTKDFDETTL